MNTENNDLADQTAQDNDFSQKAQRSEGSMDPGELALEEDSIIELTDMVEDAAAGDADSGSDEGENISLDTEALEEEEIIELVDAVEDEAEDVLDLTDMVEDDTAREEEGMPDEVMADDEFDAGLVEDVEIGLEEDTADITAGEDAIADSETAVELEDVGLEGEEPHADQAAEEALLEPEVIEPVDIPSESTGPAVEEVIREKLSDEKIEAIVTKVVRDTIEQKADRILLEVAEAAIATEIEKIKKAL